MRKIINTRGAGIAFAAIALTALVNTPASASISPNLPGPAAGIIAAGAVIGVVVVARWWRRR